MIWWQCEGDDGVNMVSTWRDDGGGYPLTILLFFIKAVYDYIKFSKNDHGYERSTPARLSDFLTSVLSNRSSTFNKTCTTLLSSVLEGIDQVVKTIPYDKASGPDDFSGMFIKKCRHIIRDDIYELCMNFFNGVVDLQAINNSFITLVPKVNNPTMINEFMPISLINCIVKIIIKLLGDRIQSVIIPLVHQNQYEFIKCRTIQDCLA
jgi:hypothetical protein